MADHLKFERYFWFDRRVREGHYPNAGSLACRFEISTKTAQRTIVFMRDRLGAPLEYDPVRTGYAYTDHSFALPSFQVTQNELLAILLAKNLLIGSAEGVISRAIQSFGRKLFATAGAFGFDRRRIDTAFSAIWFGYTPAEGEIFRLVAEALIQNRQIAFDYFSPNSNRTSRRLVEPAHLQHYMGSWVLLARCTECQDWRKFLLGRMSQVHLSETGFTACPPSHWQALLHGAFGIFQGSLSQEVTLQFTPYRARWIINEKWHSSQVMEIQSDGSLILRLMVTDFREIKLRILQYGSEVEVLSPEDLRNEVRNEIEKMMKVYQDR